MVVLDGHNMLGTGPNQYLQPDYLSALPITLDAKKSPLALLAQTCSQIGADSPNTKSLLPSNSSIDKRKSSTSSEGSSLNCAETSSNNLIKQERDTNSRPRSGGNPPPSKSTTPSTSSASSSTISHRKSSSPPFKPYESSSTSTSSFSSSSSKLKGDSSPKSETNHNEKVKSTSKRPASSSPHDSSAKSARRSPTTPTNHSAPPLTNGSASEKLNNSSSSSSSSDSGKSSPNKINSSNNNNNANSCGSSNNSERGASPIIRSGLEVLHGHGLNGKVGSTPTSSALSSLSALAAHYPPGFDPTNPAMRPGFFAPPSAHHLFGGGYPGMLPGPGGSPYVSYTRVKTPSGAETIVPVCKDPYCTGCSLSLQGLMANAAVAAAAVGFPAFAGHPGSPTASGGICPAGCVQCDHQKYAVGLPPFMSGLGLPPTSTAAYQSSFLSQAQAAAAQQQQQHAQRPYICNWIVGESYCGKRFPSSEELLQHLRTHTNLSTSEASNLSAMSSASSLYSNALLNSSMGAAAAAAAAAMHRGYPTSQLDSASAAALNAARYHPYAQAAAAAAAAAAASGKPPPGSIGLPSSLAPPHSLANYYQNMSPYALYGQRIGPPVHQ